MRLAPPERPMRSIVKGGRDTTFCVQDSRGSRGQFFAWNGPGSSATERACVGEARRILGYLMLHSLWLGSFAWLHKWPALNA